MQSAAQGGHGTAGDGAPAPKAKRNERGSVGAQENLGKCRGQELVLGKELPVDSPLVQELPAKIERGQEVNLELLLVVEEVDAGQTNLHAGKDHRAVDDTEEAAVLEENDQKAREEEENVHLDAEGEAGGVVSCVPYGHGSSPPDERGGLPVLEHKQHHAGVEQYHGEGVVEQPQQINRVGALAEHEGNEQPLWDVLGTASEEVDGRDENKSDEFDTEEYPLRRTLACSCGQELVEHSVDVQVECRVDERACLAFNLGIIALAREEHVDLLHVCGPVNLGVWQERVSKRLLGSFLLQSRSLTRDLQNNNRAHHQVSQREQSSNEQEVTARKEEGLDGVHGMAEDGLEVELDSLKINRMAAARGGGTTGDDVGVVWSQLLV